MQTARLRFLLIALSSYARMTLQMMLKPSLQCVRRLIHQRKRIDWSSWIKNVLVWTKLRIQKCFTLRINKPRKARENRKPEVSAGKITWAILRQRFARVLRQNNGKTQQTKTKLNTLFINKKPLLQTRVGSDRSATNSNWRSCFVANRISFFRYFSEKLLSENQNSRRLLLLHRGPGR